MLSISKLTRDLNCLITFSDNSITWQDRSTGRTIGIGREFQGLFHITSPSSSTACTSMETPLLIHSRLGHSNISKFRIMVPHFSSLSSIECESCQLGKHSRVSFPSAWINGQSLFSSLSTQIFRVLLGLSLPRGSSTWLLL